MATPPGDPENAGVGDGLDAAAAADFLNEAEAGESEVERRRLLVPADLHGQRLDKALATLVGEFSRSYLQGLIARGHVKVDGWVVAGASRKVVAGQALEIELVPTAESRAFRAEPLPLAIVFEDEYLLVVDKAAGMVVHPAAGNWSGTLLNALLAHHAGAASLPRAGIVHRLDKDTSGLMVVAKTLPASTALVRAIAAREVHREYRAIAHGTVAPPMFSVERAIGRDPKSRVRMAVVASGRPARTDVHVLACTDDLDVAASALRCVLHTGRTHQIRVHLASCGHPLVADPLYGGRPALGLQRQALHAARLMLAHPVTQQPLTFEAAAPNDFEAAWQQVRQGRG